MKNSQLCKQFCFFHLWTTEKRVLKTKVLPMCIDLGHRGQNLYLLPAGISLFEVGVSDLREVLAAVLLLSLRDEDFLFWCSEFVFCDQNAVCKELKRFFHLVLPSDGIHTVLLPNPHWTKSPKNAFFYAPRPFFKNSFLFSFRSGAGSVHSEALRWEGEHIRPNVYCSITSVTWSASLSQYRCKFKHCLGFPLFGSIAVFLYNDSESEMFLWKGTSLSVDNQNVSASFKYWYTTKLHVVITFPHCCFMAESPISYAFSGKTHLTLPFQICLQFPGDAWFFLHPKHVFLPHGIPSLHSPFEP